MTISRIPSPSWTRKIASIPRAAASAGPATSPSTIRTVAQAQKLPDRPLAFGGKNAHWTFF